MKQVVFCVNIGGPPSKSNFLMIDSEKYCEGKVKMFKNLNIIFLKFNANKQLKLFKVTAYLLYNGSMNLF